MQFHKRILPNILLQSWIFTKSPWLILRGFDFRYTLTLQINRTIMPTNSKYYINARPYLAKLFHTAYRSRVCVLRLISTVSLWLNSLQIIQLIRIYVFCVRAVLAAVLLIEEICESNKNCEADHMTAICRLTACMRLCVRRGWGVVVWLFLFVLAYHFTHIQHKTSTISRSWEWIQCECSNKSELSLNTGRPPMILLRPNAILVDTALYAH